MSVTVRRQHEAVPAPPPTDTFEEDDSFETVNGVRVEALPMSRYANRVADQLLEELVVYLRQNRIGQATKESMFILDVAADVRKKPDVAYVSAGKSPLDEPVSLEGEWEVIPDIAVEVWSPHDRATTAWEKVREYLALGVVEVWLIVCESRDVIVIKRDTTMQWFAESDALTTPLLPGFAVTVGSLFPPQRAS